MSNTVSDFCSETCAMHSECQFPGDAECPMYKHRVDDKDVNPGYRQHLHDGDDRSLSDGPLYGATKQDLVDFEPEPDEEEVFS